MKPYSKLLTLAAPFRADELSSVSEYLYQSIIFAESHRELAELSVLPLYLSEAEVGIREY